MDSLININHVAAESLIFNSPFGDNELLIVGNYKRFLRRRRRGKANDNVLWRGVVEQKEWTYREVDDFEYDPESDDIDMIGIMGPFVVVRLEFLIPDKPSEKLWIWPFAEVEYAKEFMEGYIEHHWGDGAYRVIDVHEIHLVGIDLGGSPR